MSVPPQKGLLLPGEVRPACQGTEPVSAVQFSPAGQMIRPGEVATRPHSHALYNKGLTFKSLSPEMEIYLYDFYPSYDFKSLDAKKENQDMKLYFINIINFFGKTLDSSGKEHLKITKTHFLNYPLKPHSDIICMYLSCWPSFFNVVVSKSTASIVVEVDSVVVVV